MYMQVMIRSLFLSFMHRVDLDLTKVEIGLGKFVFANIANEAVRAVPWSGTHTELTYNFSSARVSGDKVAHCSSAGT